MSLIINDTSYAGTFASQFWLPATFQADTLRKGVVNTIDGIKKAHTIGTMDFTNPLQKRVATPTPNTSNFDINGRVLTPQDIMVYSEFNPRDFEQHWLAEQLSPTLLAREVPVQAENYMLQIALNRAMEQLENGIWMGSTTYTATPGRAGNGQIVFFDGFIKKMVNDAAVLKVASPLPLSAAPSSVSVYNIKDAMEALISLAAANAKALIADPLRYDRMKFLVSVNTQQIWQDYLTSALDFKGNNTTDRAIDKYRGYTIEALAGMPDNTIVFTRATDDFNSSLHVGMNSTEDNELQLMRLQNNSELFFIKGLMKFDTQYKFSAEAFLFTTLTSGTFTA